MYALLMFSFWKTFLFLKMLDLKEICNEAGWTYRSFPEVETVSASSNDSIVLANLLVDHHNGFLEYSVVDSDGEVVHNRVYGSESVLNRRLRTLLISEFPGYLYGCTDRNNVFERNSRFARFALG